MEHAAREFFLRAAEFAFYGSFGCVALAALLAGAAFIVTRWRP